MSNELSMNDFLSALGRVHNERIEDDLGCGFVRLCRDEAEARQALQDIACVEDALIELLRNARDAKARNIYVVTHKREGMRFFTILDDGLGIPKEFHERIFEARVTSKLNSLSFDTWGVHGRGMALFSIKYHAQEAYVAQSVEQQGTVVVVSFDTTTLRERREQSALPELWRTEEGLVQVRGPKNIYRTCAEFLLDSSNPPKLYVGTPTEIAATLLAHARIHKRIAKQELLSYEAFLYSLADASTPAEFATAANALGLEMSDRSARRILDGEIPQIPDFSSYLSAHCLRTRSEDTKRQESKLESYSLAHESNAKAEHVLHEDLSTHTKILSSCEEIKISLESVEHDKLEYMLKKALKPLFEAYYLEEDVSVNITTKKGVLRLEIPTISRSS